MVHWVDFESVSDAENTVGTTFGLSEIPASPLVCPVQGHQYSNVRFPSSVTAWFTMSN